MVVFEIFYRKELVVQIPHGQLEEITRGKSRVVLREATMALNKKSNGLCELTVFDNAKQYSLILDHNFDFKLPIVRDGRIILKWRDNRHTFEFIARQDASSLFSKLLNSLQECTTVLGFSSNTVDKNPQQKGKADPAPRTVQHEPPITHAMHIRQSGSARRTTIYEPPEPLPESPSDIESYSSDEEGDIFEKPRYVGHSDDNSFTVVGSKNTFGFRGSVIDVYNTNGSELLTDIYIETNRGNLIRPSDGMLYRNESQLLLWEKNPSTIFVLDLHKGKVVDKWDFGKTSIDILAPKSKFASQSDTQDLLGASSHALFRIDPRNPRKVIPGFSYLQKNVFSCLATTENEAIAAGSLHGDIRMYNDSLKRAKTHVPIPGNEISSISPARRILPTQQETPLFDGLLVSHKREDNDEAIDRLVNMTPVAQQLTGECATNTKGNQLDLSEPADDFEKTNYT
ncbi:hypothetical protein E8E15_001018 [Penicillium rubens]|nr:hypothetical protein E8E15_001018 [Penicillium rubens]